MGTSPLDQKHVTEALPPVALAISLIDCINRCDLATLSDLLSNDHRLEVFDEEPVIGKHANTVAWNGYFEMFPAYVIHPRQIAEHGDTVAILGHTTGSHLGLRDEDERKLTLIWLVDTRDGYVTRWQLIEDNAENRGAWGLGSPPPRRS
ncbi:MAG TPA: nuclear transport factor 2 family protein [Solirubrobacteraceae bacterium]|nr:nuclear transport factor 2 family protein [Solirubrobacteraceae bacterium]